MNKIALLIPLLVLLLSCGLSRQDDPIESVTLPSLATTPLAVQDEPVRSPVIPVAVQAQAKPVQYPTPTPLVASPPRSALGWGLHNRSKDRRK